MKDNSKRQNIISSLNEYFVSEAKRLNWQIKHQDEALQKVNQEMKEALKSEPRLVKTYMSMPGIGPANALALLAYIGNGSRFSHAKQVSHYAGLVPRVDILNEIKNIELALSKKAIYWWFSRLAT